MLRECQAGIGRHGHEFEPEPPSDSGRPLLPHYTIEIVTTEQVRLHESAGDREFYLTLSHRWKIDSVEPLRTTTTNVEAHRRGIPWETLGKTFRDAITFTKYLGIKFLWIDSLCILQDDLEDWSRESKEMCNVYGNATLSIFATSPEGLFFERRDVWGRRSQHRTYCTTDQTGHNHGIHAVASEAQHDHDTDYSLLPDSEIFTRGWVFQEWLMCKRAIVFDIHELLWSCDHSKICECGGATPLRDRSIGEMNRNEYRESLRRGEQSSLLWHSVVTQYSLTHLTFHIDRLSALSGLAKQYRADFETNYVAGCWRDGMIDTLLWYGGSESIPCEYVAPTWSWASARPNVFFMTVGRGIIKDLAQVTDVSCTLATSDPTGRVNDGSLTMIGPAVDGVVVWSEDEGSELSMPCFESGEVRYSILPDCRVYGLRDGVAATRRTPTLCLIVRVTLVYPHPQHPVLQELALVFVRSARRPNCYERIGLIDTTHNIPSLIADEHLHIQSPAEDFDGSYTPEPEEHMALLSAFLDRLKDGEMEDTAMPQTLLRLAYSRSVTIV